MTTTVSNIDDVTSWGVASHAASLYIDRSAKELDGTTFAMDVETDEKDNFVCLCLATADTVDVFFELTDDLKLLLVCADLIGHNIKADVQWLRKWGIAVRDNQILFDTMLAAYTLDSTLNDYGLKSLASQRIGMEYPGYKQIVGTGKKKQTLDQQPRDIVANYNGNDGIATFRLYKLLDSQLSAEQKKYLKQVEMPTSFVLTEMESVGMLIDMAKVQKLDAKFGREMEAIQRKIKELAPSISNINSNAQVGEFLLSKGLKLPKTEKSRKPAVNKKALEAHKNVPFVKLLLRYSEVEKLKSTYTEVLIERAVDKYVNYRLTASFNQAVTATGRLSSSRPNLQNIPSRTKDGQSIRACFIADEGYSIVDADFSQIEPRLMAHFSQDTEMLRIFKEGLDLYDAISEYVGCTRQVAKILWLALAYNAGAYKIAEIASITTNQAFRFLDKMKERFPKLFYWKEKTIKQAEIDGYVDTLFGRRIPLLPDDSGKAPNYRTQGSAAEVMKLALQATKHFRSICNVHDEILFEVPTETAKDVAEEIKASMEKVIKLDIPLVVDIGIGPSWSEAKQ